jgi:hypothetical protein
MHQRGYVWQIRFFLRIYTFVEYISQMLPTDQVSKAGSDPGFRTNRVAEISSEAGFATIC